MATKTPKTTSSGANDTPQEKIVPVKVPETQKPYDPTALYFNLSNYYKKYNLLNKELYFLRIKPHL